MVLSCFYRAVLPKKTAISKWSLRPKIIIFILFNWGKGSIVYGQQYWNKYRTAGAEFSDMQWNSTHWKYYSISGIQRHRCSNVPSHSRVLYPDTEMKNGTENLLQDRKIDSTVFIDLISADTDVEDWIHRNNRRNSTCAENSNICEKRFRTRNQFPTFFIDESMSLSLYRYGSATQKIIS